MATELVGNPLARQAGVIQIEPGGNRVHPQAIYVILVQPEQSARQQEPAHFVASVVEDQRAPVLMLSLADIGMLVQIGAVEKGKPVSVLGEMRRNPIHDHSYPRLVRFIVKVTKIIRCSKAGSWGKISGGLITPGAVIRKLSNRQKLDVGVAHLLDVTHELFRELT